MVAFRELFSIAPKARGSFGAHSVRGNYISKRHESPTGAVPVGSTIIGVFTALIILLPVSCFIAPLFGEAH